MSGPKRPLYDRRQANRISLWVVIVVAIALVAYMAIELAIDPISTTDSKVSVLSLFGFSLPASPAPTLDLAERKVLRLGQTTFEASHTPGHTPGHCVFYCADAGACFCGDLIFKSSVGRTDLPGCDWEALVATRRLSERQAEAPARA